LAGTFAPKKKILPSCYSYYTINYSNNKVKDKLKVITKTEPKEESYKKWLLPRKSSAPPSIVGANKTNSILSQNRFASLHISSDITVNNSVVNRYNENFPKLGNVSTATGKVLPKQTKDSLYASNYPERQGDQRHQKKVPCKSTKIAIFSDSIPKRFNMTDFNKKLNCGEAILKAFPGATT